MSVRRKAGSASWIIRTDEKNPNIQLTPPLPNLHEFEIKTEREEVVLVPYGVTHLRLKLPKLQMWSLPACHPCRKSWARSRHLLQIVDEEAESENLKPKGKAREL